MFPFGADLVAKPAPGCATNDLYLGDKALAKKVPLVAGCVISLAAYLLLATEHGAHWQVYLASLLVGIVFSRIVAEFVLIVFRINEHLGAIRDQQGLGYLPDGTARLSRGGEELRHFMGTSTFAEYTVMPEIALAKVSPEAPLDGCAPFACRFACLPCLRSFMASPFARGTAATEAATASGETAAG